ncbi:MAG TPA: DUF72 domain-containing protein [Pirellulales bacterium]|nr:DUF72 domain-containing protein [Pirellulales bacterium]
MASRALLVTAKPASNNFRMQGAIRIGTSGWIYPHWRERFYPARLPQKKWFEYYCEHFDTVEINNTFYRLGRPEAFEALKAQTPRGFAFAAKCNRFLTHNLKLTRPEEPLERFFDRVGRLGKHLGPVLYQLPPRWTKNVARLDEFCAHLPRKYSHVVEFREASWLDPEVFAVLERHKVGLCIHDLLPDHPRHVFGRIGYVRFHGASGKYSGSYTKRQLRSWAKWMRDAAENGARVYAYFNNDAEAHAIHTARTLRELVG